VWTAKFHNHIKQPTRLYFYISSSLQFLIANWKTNIKFLGNWALDTSLKYLWTFPIALSFHYTHNTTFQMPLLFPSGTPECFGASALRFWQCYSVTVLQMSRPPALPQRHMLPLDPSVHDWIPKSPKSQFTPQHKKSLNVIKPRCGVYFVFSPRDTGGYFPGVKVAEAWNWLLIFT
jgi:hypothetical protein